MCSRCVCDTTIASIVFDEDGICNFCRSHDVLEAEYAPGPALTAQFNAIVQTTKKEGRGKDYDCIVGVSGGTDSSYTLHLARSLGLRPLAVHFDNGWNTHESVSNIKNIITKLGVDLYTYVVDWEEFRDLQKAFLEASVPCIETPTDVAIHGVLYRLARKEGLRFIFGGQSFRAEGTVPREWSYLDGTYIRTVQKQFGHVRLKSYPNLTLSQIAYWTFARRIRQIPLLNYVTYNKTEAKALLAREYGWKDYPGHHYENVYSRFAFGWYLPKKFNIDKRKISYSGPVRSGQMTREEALQMLAMPPKIDEQLVDYVINKLEMTKTEFDRVLALPPKTYQDYYTSEQMLRYAKLPVWLAVKMGFLTPVLYEKYFSGLGAAPKRPDERLLA
jgi:N-acetyl sugar amidotransferase